MLPTPEDSSAPDSQPQSPAQMDIHDLSRSMYGHMRAIGGQLMNGERRDHTLNATALVNEAIVRLLGSGEAAVYNNRAHLLAAASLAMRHVLVDHARARGAAKRGPGGRRVTWDDVGHAIAGQDQHDLLLEISELVDKMSAEDPMMGDIAQFRLFGGMEQAEIARVLGVSLSTVEKRWKLVRERLGQELGVSRPG
jgi:RNA polymerase sigma-70 factor (ECF subfamily)